MRRMLRGSLRGLLLPVLLLVFATPSQAQNLRETVENLFRLSGDACPEPLCLAVDPERHGRHFIPALTQGQSDLVTFLTNAIGVSVANVPISATSSGATFSFQGGVPVRTSVSSGPIFAERAQTLGRRRLLLGANVSNVSFQSLRGVAMDRLDFNFTHANVDFPGCDEAFGGDCTPLGFPDFENDFIAVRTALDVDLFVTTFFATYGLFDWVDLGVAVPLVYTSISGRSSATLIPFDPEFPHLLGPVEDPGFEAVASGDGSATGVGDVAARLKVNLTGDKRTGFAVLADVRIPTGDEEDFLGAGDVSARGIGIISSRLGNFSPHANAGYLYRGGDFQNSAVLGTVGFDQLLSSWATFALDVISEWQLGDSELKLPGPTRLVAPRERTILPTIIPDRKDNRVDLSAGVKLTSAGGFTVLANALIPMNNGGMRPDAVWTAGVEYSF